MLDINVKKILSRYDPYFYKLIHYIDIIENKEVPVAGINIYSKKISLEYNPEYFDTIDKKTKSYIILHELFHIVLRHITFLNKFNKEKFNIAADIYINHILDMTYETIHLGVKKEDYHLSKDQVEKGVVYIYNLLPDTCKIKTIYSSFSNTENLKQEDLEDLQELINTSIGSVSNNLKKFLNIEPRKRNWKSYITNFFIANSNSYFIKKSNFKPNKYYVDVTTLKAKPKSKILVVVDTSGSMSNLLEKAFSEIITIATNLNSDINIIESDCSVNVNNIYEYKNKKNFIDRIKNKGVSGGGGTSLDPSIKYINKKYKDITSVIYITDGYLNTPKEKCKFPLLIGIVGNNKDLNNFKNYKIIEICD